MSGAPAGAGEPSAPLSHLYQTPEWAAVRAGDGWRSERVAGPWGAYPVLVRPIPLLGKALVEAPYGPPGPYDDPAAVDALLAELLAFARRARAAAVRIHPYPAPPQAALPGSELARRFAAHGFRRDRAPLGYTHTYLVDLGTGEEALWQELAGRARTAVRKSERAGIAVETSERLESFARLYFAMATRTGLVPERPGFFARLERIALAAGAVRVLEARAPGPAAPPGALPLAAALLSTVGGVAIYLWGATAPEVGATGASERLQWEAIRWARGAGLHRYDLGGVTPGAAKGSKKAGIEHFKRQFGGALVELPGTYMRILDPMAARAAGIMRRLRARLAARGARAAG